MELLFFALWMAATGWASPRLALETPGSAMLGVPLTVRAALSAPESGLVLETVRSSTAAVAVLGAPARPDRSTFEISLLPLDLGPQTFELTWTFRNSSGSRQSIATAMTLSVSEPESLKQNPELEDIKPPWRARKAWWPWLLAAAIVAALVLFWRGRGARASSFAAMAAASVDTRSPEERAEDDLAALEGSGIWAQGRHQDFYLRLTEIIRLYLERRRAIAATRLTSTELFCALRGQEDGRQAGALIREAFKRADLVKFAKSPADPSWGAEDLAAARALVKALAPADLAARAAAERPVRPQATPHGPQDAAAAAGRPEVKA